MLSAVRNTCTLHASHGLQHVCMRAGSAPCTSTPHAAPPALRSLNIHVQWPGAMLTPAPCRHHAELTGWGMDPNEACALALKIAAGMGASRVRSPALLHAVDVLSHNPLHACANTIVSYRRNPGASAHSSQPCTTACRRHISSRTDMTKMRRPKLHAFSHIATRPRSRSAHRCLCRI